MTVGVCKTAPHGPVSLILRIRHPHVELRLDFPLTRRVGRSFAITGPQPPDEVTVVRKQLSLRGLLPLGASGCSQVQQKWTQQFTYRIIAFHRIFLRVSRKPSALCVKMRAEVYSSWCMTQD
jgi:hypothetical protein